MAITNKRVRIFTRKSMEYKLAYMLLLEGSGGAAENNGHQHIECIVKHFKQRQSALDAD